MQRACDLHHTPVRICRSPRAGHLLCRGLSVDAEGTPCPTPALIKGRLRVCRKSCWNRIFRLSMLSFPEAAPFLSDEIRADGLFRFGDGDSGTPACFDGVQQPCHVGSKRPHDLHAFGILAHLFRRIAVDHVPVLRRYDGHLTDCEVFVELVECGCRTGSPTAYHGGCGFMCEERRASVKEPVHEAGDASRSRGKVHG